MKTLEEVDEKVTSLETTLERFITYHDLFLRRLERDMEENSKENSKQISECNRLIEKNSKENRDQIKENNKQWGALANKMGTIDEDLVAPAVRPVMEQYFKCEPLTRAIRVLKRMGSDSFEVDVLAVCEKQAFMIEVKSAPKIEHVDQILEKAKNFKRFFPEYEDKQVVPIFAGIMFSDEIIKYATKKGLYIMAYREWEYMDIINFNEVERK
jgi:hypothetical protein